MKKIFGVIAIFVAGYFYGANKEKIKQNGLAKNCAEKFNTVKEKAVKSAKKIKKKIGKRYTLLGGSSNGKKK